MMRKESMIQIKFKKRVQLTDGLSVTLSISFNAMGLGVSCLALKGTRLWSMIVGPVNLFLTVVDNPPERYLLVNGPCDKQYGLIEGVVTGEISVTNPHYVKWVERVWAQAGTERFDFDESEIDEQPPVCVKYERSDPVVRENGRVVYFYLN